MCNEYSPVDEVEYKNHTIKIFVDDDAPNPRTDFDHLAHLVCFHRRYNLGDEHNFSGVEELQDFLKDKNVIWLPVWMYDHGNITISTCRTYPYNDLFDSGMVGVIYVLKEEIRKEYSCKHISKKTLANVISLLQAEVQEYDDYLTGNVYGFTIQDEQENDIDSCWGFYGDSKYCMQEAKSQVDYYFKEQQDKEWQQSMQEQAIEA